ncbi:polypeptide N-acetylgalactosaminyltransferase 4 [Biomphalaria pfeifferi]|uniref:Polypeptide N-acetylgalactosaminyltransferase n=1 Tax=Biomphalaria pfeifferi TaxID=112525 RepID=A0AAD8AV58_BIOPF|nr:polypeptide N-acetylgalactosaminyltransferase 4 [Biomphalaria pfeifferi]
MYQYLIRPKRCLYTRFIVCVVSLSSVKLVLDAFTLHTSLQSLSQPVKHLIYSRSLPVLDVTDLIRSKVYLNVTYPAFVAYADEDGPGQMGKGHFLNSSLMTESEKEEVRRGYDRHQFDEFLSSKIALHRLLPDPRGNFCHVQVYPELPPVSIVITFYNEAWSTLLRSIHSILDRTPSKLLKEIILLDDCSTYDYLKEPLEAYLQSLDQVRLLRATQRLGLIQARNLAVEFVTSDIVVFLDSHIECHQGWLEPLITPVSRDHKVITYPLVDNISYFTFKLQWHKDTVIVGGFSLTSLLFQWMTERKLNMTLQTMEAESPTMPGGLFAVSRGWFEKLGRFDPGLVLWGGENLELSFKSWMCGGKVIQTTCSRVGHVFRPTNPNVQSFSQIGSNFLRVAEVWMDEYKHYYYEKISYNITPYGDVSDRLQLRKSLNCRSFDWYVNKVYPELKNTVPAWNELYSGLIKNVYMNLCIERFSKSILSACDERLKNQLWDITKEGLLFKESVGLMPVVTSQDPNVKPRVILRLIKSEKDIAPLLWIYNQTNRQLIHKVSGHCLEADPSTNFTYLSTCQAGSRLQSWQLTTRRERMDILRYKLQVPIGWN